MRSWQLLIIFTLAIAQSALLSAHALEANTSMMQQRRNDNAVIIAHVTKEGGIGTPAKLEVLEILMQAKAFSLTKGQKLEIDGLFAGLEGTWRLRKGVSMIFLGAWEFDGGRDYAPVLSASLGTPLTLEDYQKDPRVDFLGLRPSLQESKEALLEHLTINPRLNANFADEAFKAKAEAKRQSTPRMLLGDQRLARWKQWLAGDNSLLALDALVGAYEIADLAMPMAPRRSPRILGADVIRAMQALVLQGLQQSSRWIHSAALALGERVGFPKEASPWLEKIAKAGRSSTLYIVWHEAHRAMLSLPTWEDEQLDLVVQQFGEIDQKVNDLANLRELVEKAIEAKPSRRAQILRAAERGMKSTMYAAQMGGGYLSGHFSDEAWKAEQSRRHAERPIEARMLQALQSESPTLNDQMVKEWLKAFGTEQSLLSVRGREGLRALLPKAFGAAKGWQKVDYTFESEPETLAQRLVAILNEEKRGEAMAFFWPILEAKDTKSEKRILLSRVFAGYGETCNRALRIPDIKEDAWLEHYWFLRAQQALGSSRKNLPAFLRTLDLRKALSGRSDQISEMTKGEEGRIILPRLAAMLEHDKPFASIVILRASYWLNQRSGKWMGFTSDIKQSPEATRALKKRWQAWTSGLSARKWSESAGKFLEP